MKKSTEILQRITLAKQKMQNLLNENKVNEAHNMISTVAELENQLEAALAEESQDDDGEGFQNSNRPNHNAKNGDHEILFQNESEGENMQKFVNAKSVKNSAEFKKKFLAAAGAGADKTISFSDFIKGALFNQGEHKDFKNKVDGTVIIPQEIVSDIVYSAAPKSVLLGNCPILPMDAETVKIGRVNTNVQAKFKTPYELGHESNFELEGVELKAKTLYGWIEISEEDLQDVQNMEEILRTAFGNAAASSVDKAFLYNEFTPEMTDAEKAKFPKGIMDSTTILSIESEKPFDYTAIAKAKLEISKNDGFANVLAVTPDEKFLLETATDINGQYIAEPKFMEQFTQIESTNLKADDALVFDSNSILIGIRNEMNFKVIDNLKNGSILLRLMMRCDVATTRTNHACKIKLVNEIVG